MSFRGFDTDRVRELAGELTTLGEEAPALHLRLSEVLTRAQAAMISGPATYHADLDAVREHRVQDVLLIDISLFGSGTATLPAALGGDLASMSDEMVRRCNQLDGVRQLEEAGYAVDTSTVFLDEDPPSREDIEEAVTFFATLEDTDLTDPEELRQAMSDLDGLTSAELDIVISHVPPGQLEQYNDALSLGTMNDAEYILGGGIPYLSGGISYEERAAHLSTLFAEVGVGNIEKFMDAFPDVQPDFSNVDLEGDVEWGVPEQPLFSTTGQVRVEDIDQGSFSDCWFLASLAALTQSNPRHIQEGIRENANGTISVRLWDAAGDERWVTVTRELPLNENGDPVSASDTGGPLWAAYYEKAFAQVYGETPRGTYGAIEWDWAGNAVPHLTGGEADNISALPFNVLGSNYENVREAWENGRAITLSSTGNAPEGWEDVGYTDSHAYYVVGFTEEGNVLVGNPWGLEHFPPIEATPEEFGQAFRKPTAIDVPR